VSALVLIPIAFYERRVKREKAEKAALAQRFLKQEQVALRS
jgi:hypothetical protein